MAWFRPDCQLSEIGPNFNPCLSPGGFTASLTDDNGRGFSRQKSDKVNSRQSLGWNWRRRSAGFPLSSRGSVRRIVVLGFVGALFKVRINHFPQWTGCESGACLLLIQPTASLRRKRQEKRRRKERQNYFEKPITCEGPRPDILNNIQFRLRLIAVFRLCFLKL